MVLTMSETKSNFINRSGMTAETTTITTHLRPIDREGLLAFAEKGRNNPETRGTNKVHTITDGQYRTVSHITNMRSLLMNPFTYLVKIQHQLPERLYFQV